VIKTKKSDMGEASRMQGEQYVNSFSQNAGWAVCKQF